MPWKSETPPDFVASALVLTALYTKQVTPLRAVALTSTLRGWQSLPVRILLGS